jgi:hypothetical protein
LNQQAASQMLTGQRRDPPGISGFLGLHEAKAAA